MSARKITVKKVAKKVPTKKVAKKAPSKRAAKKTASEKETTKVAIKKVAKKIAKKDSGKLSRATSTLGAMAMQHGIPLLKAHGRTIARFGIGELAKRIKNPTIKSGLTTLRRTL